MTLQESSPARWAAVEARLRAAAPTPEERLVLHTRELREAHRTLARKSLEIAQQIDAGQVAIPESVTPQQRHLLAIEVGVRDLCYEDMQDQASLDAAVAARRALLSAVASQSRGVLMEQVVRMQYAGNGALNDAR